MSGSSGTGGEKESIVNSAAFAVERLVSIQIEASGILISVCFVFSPYVSNEKTFWYTTGMYPQELVISFGGKEVQPQNIHIVSRSVRHFTIFKCDKPEAKSWEEVWKSGEVDKNQDSLQNTQKDVSQVAASARCAGLRMNASR